ncbi:MAG TPA: ComF family protein [Bacteroidota bacterium]|nr:ComF family protein [Bacteroidota bacterium]
MDKHDAVFQRTLLALTSDGSLDGMVAPFYFEKEGPLQQLIHKLKYGGMTRIGVLVGEEIAAGIAGHRGDGNAVIVPVPLHRAKRRERGYNQSYFIGRGISRELGVPVREWALRREIYTRSQTTLDIIERAKNVEGAFRVPSRSVDALRGKTVLLVDDVITTGATIRACAAALREANVERIIACAAALAI